MLEWRGQVSGDRLQWWLKDGFRQAKAGSIIAADEFLPSQLSKPEQPSPGDFNKETKYLPNLGSDSVCTACFLQMQIIHTRRHLAFSPCVQHTWGSPLHGQEKKKNWLMHWRPSREWHKPSWCPCIQETILVLTALPRRRRQWHPTPVLLPGKSHGQRSLVGCSRWGR